MPPSLLSKERDNLIDLGWLLAGLGVTAAVGTEGRPSLLQVAIIFMVASLTSRHRPKELACSVRKQWLTRLPWQGLVIATGAGVLCWWGRLPLTWLIPLLVWPLLSFGCRLDWFSAADWALSSFRCRARLNQAVGLARDAREPLAEALLLFLVMHLGGAFWSLWPDGPASMLAASLWFGLRLLGRRFPHQAAPVAELMPPCFALGLVLLIGAGFSPAGLERGHGVVATGLALSLWTVRRLARLLAKAGVSREGELLRVVAVAGIALWVLRGFATPTMHGTPDALWYATMLHDMVLQTRAGIFPVFLGQSEYQFNGAIYPLRVAPAFHYLGALLDCLTLRSLGTFALQNLLITLIGTGAALAVYFCCCSLAPARRWLAMMLAVLFISCPGVAGIAYNTDLYMSWTTLPWVVIALWAAVRSFTHPDIPTFLALGGATGLLWWGHAPIALWSSIVLGSLQVLRLVTNFRNGPAWGPMLLAVGMFTVIAAYPVGSVLLHPPEPEVNAAGFQRASPDALAHFVRKAFPASILPLSDLGRMLGDFQFGYSLLLIWFGSVFWGWRTASTSARSLLVWSGVFLLLLLPWPWLNLAAWHTVPAFVRDTTGNWAMNRLYLLGAACMITAGALLLPRWGFGVDRSPRFKQWAVIALVLATGWSLFEVRKFAFGSTMRSHTRERSDAMLAPENILLTRFAYLIFPRLPLHFSHGVMDPQLLHRVLAADRQAVLADNQQIARNLAQPVATVPLLGHATGEAVYEATTSVTLSPGRRYLADFAFVLPPSEPVVLQVFGQRLHREYALPEYGEARSFGRGGAHTNTLSLFTSATQPESVRFRLIPSSGIPPADGALGATMQLLEYDQQQLPVHVVSWIPYRSSVTSPSPGWLETPRMYQDGYKATVNGTLAEVRKSADGLVAIALPAGDSEVTLAWQAPAGLLTLFWTSLSGILCWFCWTAWQVVRARNITPPLN